MDDLNKFDDLNVLKNKNYKPGLGSSFWALLTGQTFSQLGSFATNLSLVLWLQSVGSSGKTIGLYFFLGSITSVIVGFFAGSIIDRYNKKYILFIVDISAFLSVFTLGILYLYGSGFLYTVPLIIILRIFIITCSTFRTPAITAELSFIVPKFNLKKANSLFSTSRQIAGSAGELFGGTIFALAGGVFLFFGDALTYIFSALMTLFFLKNIPSKLKNENINHSFFIKLKEILYDSKNGIKYIKNNPGLKNIIITILIINIFYSPIVVWMPFLISNELKLGQAWLGYCNFSLGIGIIIGSIFAGINKFNSKNQYRLIFISLIIVAICMMLIFINPIKYLIIVVLSLMGASVGFFNVTVQTIIQMKTSLEYQGRVFSSTLMLCYMMTPLSQWASGILVDIVSPNISFISVFSGILLLLSSCLFFTKKVVYLYFKE